MKLPILYPRDPLPIYAQLERGLRNMILTGELKAGDRLPTVRQFAVDLKINANTVAKVYAELERAGIVETRRGVGTFVSDRTPATDPDPTDAIHRIISPALDELHRQGYTVGDLLTYLKNTFNNDNG
jgi:GntR family transcriptional regulator